MTSQNSTAVTDGRRQRLAGGSLGSVVGTEDGKPLVSSDAAVITGAEKKEAEDEKRLETKKWA